MALRRCCGDLMTGTERNEAKTKLSSQCVATTPKRYRIRAPLPASRNHTARQLAP
jgi:hypothetical protein